MLKSAIKEIMRMIGFRCTETEYQLIEEKAKKHTNGNVSEWVRFAAIHMEPGKDDVA